MSEGVTYTFDYSLWTPNTAVMLCSVPWDNSYRDIVRFDDAQAKAEYFANIRDNGYAVMLVNLVYLKYGEPIRLAVPFSGVNHCNYIVVKNQTQPVPDYGMPNTPDTFYYFINDIRYVAPNCTELDIQLDVWMTYYERVQFKQCYIERGHIGIANENSTIANLARYLIEPEGLEQGSNYISRGMIWESFLNQPPWILVMCSASLINSWGDVNNPRLTTSYGSINDGLPNGCDCYAMNGDAFKKLVQMMAEKSWIAQCIISITVVPANLVDVDLTAGSTRVGGQTVDFTIYPLQSSPTISSSEVQYDYQGISSKFRLPSRYSELLKFYAFPYSTIELTNFAGSTLNFSLSDLIMDDDRIRINVNNVSNPPQYRAYAYPSQLREVTSSDFSIINDYYTVTGQRVRGHAIEQGDFVESAIVYEDFPQCAVLTNQYINYMASTAHTRSFQESNANWSQQKALTGAQLSYDQSSAATNNMLQNTSLANNAAWQQTGIANQQALWNGIQGVASGLGSMASGNIVGGAASALTAGVNTALQQNWNNQQTGISTSLASSTARNNANLQNYNRDTNRDYANFAAKGDYAQAIAAIQAKVSDAALTPPTISGNFGGDAFNIANGFMGFCLKFKLPPDHFINQIGEYWLRYGYAINRFIVPPTDLKCMTKVTYWKMQNCMIWADIPEIHKNAIRGIFESGVSVWNEPSEINNIDLGDNKKISGVSY